MFIKSSDYSRRFPLTVHSVFTTLWSNPKCERFHSLWPLDHVSAKSFVTRGHLSFSSLNKFNLPVESSVKDHVHRLHSGFVHLGRTPNWLIHIS